MPNKKGGLLPLAFFIPINSYELRIEKAKIMDSKEIEKSKAHIIVEIIEYVPNAVLSKTIIKKTTGNITVSALALGEELAETTSPFDKFIQIIDGTAEIVITDKKFKVELGQGMVIPAHSSHRFNAKEQFKMISTIIKSGYE